jgi:hypothetical protein
MIYAPLKGYRQYKVHRDQIGSQIFSPCPGDIVHSGIGLPYRPASLCSLADRYDNPMPELTLWGGGGGRGGGGGGGKIS